MGKKLYVGNLTYQVGNSDLEQLFSPFGSVVSAQVITDRETGPREGLRLRRDEHRGGSGSRHPRAQRAGARRPSPHRQ